MPAPKVKRVRGRWTGFASRLQHRIRQSGIHRHARLLRVEEKPLSIDPVARERHRIGNAHTAAAHEDYQAFQARRIKLSFHPAIFLTCKIPNPKVQYYMEIESQPVFYSGYLLSYDTLAVHRRSPNRKGDDQ